MALVQPYFESHRALGSVWTTVAIATAIIELTGVLRRRAEATRRDAGSQLVLRACTIPGVILLVFAPRIAPAAEIHQPNVALIVGIVVFASGEAMRIWARVTLGRYFTYTVQTSGDQPVITAGPYRFVRHPSYTGVMLIVIGFGFAYGNWLGLAVLVVAAFTGLRYRIHVEEKALLEDLGDRYKVYAERHKRLIPFVW